MNTITFIWLSIGFLAGFSVVLAEDGNRESLRRSLTHHASFDQGLTADFSRGNPTLRAYVDGADRLAGGVKAALGEAASIVEGAGRFGGALHRNSTRPEKLYYHTRGILDYNHDSWSGSVSLWLRLSPDEDLEPGYCDPVMLIGSSGKQGFIFLEWSADHTPRKFRYAVRPKNEIWNPHGLGWEEIPADERPMVEVTDTSFSRDRWTHVVFTFDKVNRGKAAEGRLYIDGKLKGRIAGWDLTFGWTDRDVLLVLGTNYIGFMDDLAVFDRALTDGEVRELHGLSGGVEGLR